MSRLLRLPINQLKEHSVFDMKLAKLLESGWWHEDLATIVEARSFRTREHHCWVASIIFIKSPGYSSHPTPLQRSIYGCWVLSVEESGVELRGMLDIDTMSRVRTVTSTILGEEGQIVTG
jgi:hypothetical protein